MHEASDGGFVLIVVPAKKKGITGNPNFSRIIYRRYQQTGGGG
jgi:ribosomal protein L13